MTARAVSYFPTCYAKQREREQRYLQQFLAHSALDVAEERHAEAGTIVANLKTIDRYSDYVSAYVTANRGKFILLHEGRAEDSIKAFFSELHELYAKALANPLCDALGVITSSGFDERVRSSARRHLGSS